MRRLLPLALVCLCAAHAVSAGRSLSQTSSRNFINRNTFQWIQMTISIRNKTCEQLPSGFEGSFRNAVAGNRSRPNCKCALLLPAGDNMCHRQH